MSKRLLVLLLLFATAVAFAQSAYVNIESRLTPEQLRETGLDMLSAEQLVALNRVLRAEGPALLFEHPLRADGSRREDATASYLVVKVVGAAAVEWKVAVCLAMG